MPLYADDRTEVAKHLSGGSPRVTMLGTSFKTSGIELRERFARWLGGNASELDGVSQEFAALLTCNRVELYFVPARNGGGVASIMGRLGFGTPNEFYLKHDLDAIRHLFGVAAGLDSVAVGEEQILRQVRTAGVQARSSGNAKSIIGPLFDAAYSSGARARKAYRSPSLPSLSEMALKFAIKRLGKRPSHVLLAGTGETAKLAAVHVKGARIYLLTGTRRPGRLLSKAVRVSRSNLRSTVAKCELIVSATRRPGYVLTRDDIPDDRKKIILDLGFPRNIDPAVRSSRHVALFDLDDVASQANRRHDGSSLAGAHRIVETESARFYAWLTASRLDPTLASIYSWAEGIRANEASSALRRMPELSEKDRRVVEVMSRRLVSKLMAPHAEFVRDRSRSPNQTERLRLLQKIFGAESAD